MNIDTTTIEELEFKDVSSKYNKLEGDSQFAHHGEFGSITVIDRMTGFGWRDVETGFRAKDGKMWIASGNFSIREYLKLTIRAAIQMIKEEANTCKGK